MTRIALLIALGTLSLVGASVSTKLMEDRQLQRLAQDAKTSSEHLEVARHYEARGRDFEVKAAKHEQEADELASRNGYNAMKYKWPAMVQAPIDRTRGQAMRARRAAKESFELMAKHQKLAAKAGIQATE